MEKQKIKNYKPVTPSLRHRVTVKNPNNLEKLDRNLVKIKKKTAGRNNEGRITIRYRGGSCDHKRKLRIIDRVRELGQYSRCKVIDIQYDPNITGNIALLEPIVEELKNKKIKKIENSDRNRFYILAPSELKIGTIIEGSNYKNLENYIITSNNLNSTLTELGKAQKLSEIPIGTSIYNLSKTVKGEGKIARSAGTYCILLKTLKNEKGEEYSIVRLPSKKIIKISSSVEATIGKVSNEFHNQEIKGKAGANRWIGRRPNVRGRAKNPVDHPMGGKTRGSGGLGKPKKTAWGKLAKYQKKRIS